MHVLITGSAGFLGSHLVQKFLSEGHTVTGLDDLSTGRYENIKKFIDHKYFNFINKDVREKIFIEADLILNFACPASPKAYQADPVRTIETNFLGIINLLQLAKLTGARLVQASTSEVYGDPEESPQKESYWGNVNPVGIRSCYDEGKRAAETLCFDYKRQYGVDARVIRIFNTYGPNMAIDDGRVVSNFINQSIRNEPLTIYGDGSQTRSFCFVSDLISGIFNISMLHEPLTTPINLGNPEEYSMLDLANQILQLTNSDSKISFKKLPLDDPTQRRPDVSLAIQLIGWKPVIDMNLGLKETIAYFQSIK
jgi:UDP-glucuronate decarboxylase